TITVRTEYRGAAPEDVEDRVSERIQESLSTTPNLVRIWSVSRAEISDVVLEFRWGTRITFAMQDVREKLDRVFLPPEVDRPILLRYDPNLDPVLRIGVSGPGDLRRLRRLARDDLKRELEGLSGVAAVRVRGGLEDEVRVAVDTRELSKRNLSFDLVAKRLREENLNAAGGKLEEGDTEFLVRTLNQFRSVDDIAGVVLASVGGADVRLKDVAQVEPWHRDRDVVVRIEDREAVELAIYREADANIVDLANEVKERVFGTPQQKAYVARLDSGELDRAAKAEDDAFAAKASPTLEEQMQHAARVGQRKADREAMTAFLARRVDPSIHLTLLSDQSRFIRDAIDDVRNSAIVGGVLAILILYLYLRRFFDTAIIGLSIPISVVATFAPMFLLGVSLNVMSLGGLALGIGMIVDDAIVALESIFRCRHEGDSIVRAAVRGISEVAGAITASTLTAVAVFFPILFVEGIAGQLFSDQSLTVVVSRLVSLVFALFFIPMLASRRVDAAAGGRVSARDVFAGMRWVNPLRWIPNLFLFAGRVFVLVSTYAMRAGAALLVGLWWCFRMAFTPIQWTFDFFNGALERAYPRVLRFALGHRWAVVIGVVAMLAVAASRLGRLGSQLLPDVHQGEFTAEVQLAVGTPVESTDAFFRPVARDISRLADVDEVILASGVDRDALSAADEGDHTAKITIRLRRGEDLAAREEAMIDRIRGSLSLLPEVRQVRFRKPTLFSISTPVEVEVRGRDLETLGRLALEAEKALASEPTLSDVRSTLRRGNPEVAVRFRRDEMLRYGLDATAVAGLLRGVVLGDVATTFVDGDQRTDVRVRASRQEIDGLAKLEELAVNPGQPKAIPLKAVADLDVREGPAEIRRIGNTRAAVVTAATAGLDLGGVSERLRGKLGSISKPAGYEVELGGQKR
ncbi:MAG TPA: efflux RND transporter permease subunit, partial [Planctomycetota bacterium]|nr:efflux RND transporter permease subunit [Planctomycetota bacterium]